MKHIHYELMTWWATNPTENKIERKQTSGGWFIVPIPSWNKKNEYRKYNKHQALIDWYNLDPNNKIEILEPCGKWYEVNPPSWNKNTEYRKQNKHQALTDWYEEDPVNNIVEFFSDSFGWCATKYPSWSERSVFRKQGKPKHHDLKKWHEEDPVNNVVEFYSDTYGWRVSKAPLWQDRYKYRKQVKKRHHHELITKWLENEEYIVKTNHAEGGNTGPIAQPLWIESNTYHLYDKDGGLILTSSAKSQAEQEKEEYAEFRKDPLGVINSLDMLLKAPIRPHHHEIILTAGKLDGCSVTRTVDKGNHLIVEFLSFIPVNLSDEYTYILYNSRGDKVMTSEAKK